MPLPAPRPLDALRQHTHAVILTAGDGVLSGQLRGTVGESGVESQVIGHPILAMARLTNLCRGSRGEPNDRPALVVTDRQIDDLSPLFAAVRDRLPRVSIWVFEADLAIEIQRGQHLDAPKPPSPPTPAKPHRRDIRPAPPALRIAGVSPDAAAPDPIRHAERSPLAADADFGVGGGNDLGMIGDGLETDRDLDPLEPSGDSVTRAELEMLLDPSDPDTTDGDDSIQFGGPR